MISEEEKLINIIFKVGMYTKNSNILKLYNNDQYIDWVKNVLKNAGFHTSNMYHGSLIDPDIIHEIHNGGPLDPKSQSAN